MKKIMMVAMIAVAMVGMIGCGADETKADLRWKNEHGSNVTDIQWISASQENQKWTGTWDNGTNNKTNYQGINKLDGHGECLFEDGTGIPQPIELDPNALAVEGISVNGSDNVVVTENAAATLVIKAILTK